MKMEDMNNELDEVHKSLKTFANARKFVINENKEIVKACRESINAAHAANAALPGAQSDQLKKSKEKAFKAANLLKKVQKRLKTDYGKSWRLDLDEWLSDSEQEVIEAFAERVASESNDMMRLLENDCSIKGVLSSFPILGVDNPEDILKAEQMMANDHLVNLYSQKYI